MSLKNNAAKLAVVAMVALSLTACANTQKDSDKKVDTATSVAKPSAASSAAKSTDKASEAKGAVVLENGFVKAKGTDKDMTGMFGTLRNTSDKTVTVTGFSTNLDARKYEVHETKNGVMQEKKGGIELPAGGTYELKPGGDHLMIMGLPAAIAAGDTVKVTLKLSDGSEIKDIILPVRTIASGQENYGANGGVQGNSGMSAVPSPSAAHH